MMEKSKIFNQVINTIHQFHPDLKGIYVFGSFATQTQTADSDLDIALLANQPLDPLILFHISQEIAYAIGKEVDLIDLSQASTVFQAQIVTKGFRIESQNHHACEIFEDFVYSQYMRLNDLRAPLIQDILKRGSIYENG